MQSDLYDYFLMINNANKALSLRYLNMIKERDIESQKEISVVAGLINQIIEQPSDKIAPDKTSRWIGFIQSELIRFGITSVEDERNFSRPIFQEIYKKFNFNQPTISIKEV